MTEQNSSESSARPLTTIENRCLALAAVFQASILVAELAQKGHCDDAAYQSLIDSLFIFEADNTLQIYGNTTENLQIGLKQLSQFSQQSNNPQFSAMAKYALSLLSLQKQARKDGEMLNLIRSRLEHMQYRQEHFSEEQEGVDMALASSLSGLYQDTLSTLKFRIKVQGNMEKLTNTQISDKIRALLFAGFRSALLWQQLGGTKWQLIFKRAEIERVSQQLLKTQ